MFGIQAARLSSPQALVGSLRLTIQLEEEAGEMEAASRC